MLLNCQRRIIFLFLLQEKKIEKKIYISNYWSLNDVFTFILTTSVATRLEGTFYFHRILKTPTRGCSIPISPSKNYLYTYIYIYINGYIYTCIFPIVFWFINKFQLSHVQWIPSHSEKKIRDMINNFIYLLIFFVIEKKNYFTLFLFLLYIVIKYYIFIINR